MISIIIPVFNAGKRLETTIKSAINQTYQDIEIVCVDDGSTDNSLDILRNFEKSDYRIKVIHQNNMGVSAARNKALFEAKGEYIMFLDADDWLECNACEIALNKMVSADVDIVMWPYIRECGNQSLPKEIFRREIYYNEKSVKHKLHRRFVGLYKDELIAPEKADALCTVWGKLYKRESIIDKGIQFHDLSEIGTYEDGLFNLEVFQWIKSAIYIPEYLYHYRRDDSSSLTNKYNPNLSEQWNRLFDIILDYVERNKLSKDYYIAFNNRITLSLIVLGINEFNSEKSIYGKVQGIKRIACSKRYRDAIQKLDFKYLPLHWKVFFGFAKHRCAVGVYLMIIIIQKLRGR